MSEENIKINKTFDEFVSESSHISGLTESRDVASIPGGTPNGNHIQMTEYSLDGGRGLQITTGMKNWIQISDPRAAISLGKLLIKWAKTQR